MLICSAILVHRASVFAFDHNPVILSRNLEQFKALRLHRLTELPEKRRNFLLCSANR